MDQIYGNVDVPAVGNYSGEDPSDYYSNIPDRPCPVSQPHGSGAEEKVSTSRVVPMLPLALGLGLLLTLPALIAVAHLYVTGQAKLNLIENLHRNLSATLNITDLIAGVEELLVKNEALLTRQISFDASSGCRVCPDAWAHHSGKCYFFSSSGKNWKQSQDYCLTLGGHLVIVNNQEEQNFLSQSAIEDYYWIGLSDLETEGQWIWVDGTPLNKTGAVFWLKRPNGKDEPDNWKGDEHCGLLYKGGDWRDVSCKDPQRFVCEAIATN
ncbi:CD209 antigen-like protein E isoform X2 [Alosa sapidissima]|uniref:CD209 antigen-like protein E isoform X2 n=1 Tax=Alosa sapidissima TaxID=34773 RepID=UPI001C0885E0|nr:CD209 antigen-like protein E isoform X2 [Alosa sapidissima]